MYAEAWVIPNSYDSIIISFFSDILNKKAGLFPSKGTVTDIPPSRLPTTGHTRLLWCLFNAILMPEENKKRGAIVLG
jgi:hypothetical protein